MKEHKDIPSNNELKDAPLLQSLKGKRPFRVPDAYFDELEDAVMSEIKNTPAQAKHATLPLRKTLYYAAAAILIAFFVFIAIRSGSDEGHQPKVVENTPKKELVQPKQEKKQELPEVQVADNNDEAQQPMRGNNAEDIPKINQVKGSDILLEQEQMIAQSPQQNKAEQNATEQAADVSQEAYAQNDIPEEQILPNNYGGGYGGGTAGGQNGGYDLGLARKAVSEELNLGKKICSNKAVRLNALITDIKAVRYQWSSGDTTASIKVSESGIYTVEVYDFKDNLLGGDTIDVKIIPKPKPDLGPDRSICNYESVLISSGCNNKEFTYQWSVSDLNTPEIYLTNMEPGEYPITLKVMSCADTVSSRMLLTVKDCNIKIPNVITPNGDGRNDRFVIFGLEHYSGSHLHIMDRNGSIVYEAMDYKNDWDAANVPDGTYFYRLQLNDGKNSEKNGTLTIIRK
jgi:gliding motility-associated-like protein